jgi:hypothetical protein
MPDMTRALVRTVGGRPVAPSGLTVLPGLDARVSPARSARVARAEAVVRAARLDGLAAEARARLGQVSRIEDAAARARKRAAAGRAGRPRALAQVDALERACAAEGFESDVFVGLALAARRARRDLGADDSRPLVVLGEHPGLGDALAGALGRHPQVVHLPEA